MIFIEIIPPLSVTDRCSSAIFATDTGTETATSLSAAPVPVIVR